jgi:hypothetical protein
MSLNNLKMPAFLVESLFGNQLINSSANANSILTQKTAKDDLKQTKTAENLQFKFLGKNEKNILLLVNEEDHPFLGDEELGLLLNILGACNIAMQDVALVNLSNYRGETNSALQAQFAPMHLLFFGTTPEALGFPLQIPMYKIQPYNNQQYLVAPNLQQLLTDKAAKKNLWAALKNMFTI